MKENSTTLVVDYLYFALTAVEKITIKSLQSVKSHVMQYKKKNQEQLPVFSRFVGLNYLLIFLFFPWYCLYWFYFVPIRFILSKLAAHLFLPIKILRRRSRLANNLARHVTGILRIWEQILQKLLSSKISELLAFCIGTIIEVNDGINNIGNKLHPIANTFVPQIVLAMIWPFQQPTSEPVSVTPAKVFSSSNLSELVRYEEFDVSESNDASSMNRRSLRSMHNYIPLNPFRATVRIRRPRRDSAADEAERFGIEYHHQSPNTQLNNYHHPEANGGNKNSDRSVVGFGGFFLNLPGYLVPPIPRTRSRGFSAIGAELQAITASAPLLIEDLDNQPLCPKVDLDNVDSPASFPPSPFSRAYVMNRASERVVSVMFAARDRLRMEAQSVSRDEYSRTAAREAQDQGQSAAFDARQPLGGIAFTCGNHCALKVGKGLVCSCRAMMPVRTNAMVYFEFSVTVSSAQIPQLALGLAPPDSPLNIMVGTWSNSVGLYFDGQIMIGSHWFPSSTQEKIAAGSTIGVLCYLPSVTRRVSLGEDVAMVVPLSPQRNQAEAPELVYPDQAFGVAPPLASSSSGSTKSNPSTSSSVTNEEKLLVRFHINGEAMEYESVAQEKLQDLLQDQAPLYPTVSIFSEDTRVWCRLCEDDVVFRDRATVRAPPGVRVYCLDGSLLLSEND